jgi:hypothetical protein
LVVAYDLEKANEEAMQKLGNLYKDAAAKGYYVGIATGSSTDVIDATKKKYGYAFDFLFCDATALKTVERANPSFVLLNYGTIKQKVHYNDMNDLNL